MDSSDNVVRQAGMGEYSFIHRNIYDACHAARRNAHIFQNQTQRVASIDAAFNQSRVEYQLIGTLPAIYPEWLGGRLFCDAHRVRFPYVVGEMARGISSVAMVEVAAKNGLFAFFGSAGLSETVVAGAIEQLQRKLPNQATWGMNLIHSPQSPSAEMNMAKLFVAKAVNHISTSAFMNLTPALVYCAVKGIQRAPSGEIIRPRHCFAKISHPHVAQQFMLPIEKKILDQLLKQGDISVQEHALGQLIPLAEDITVEADSGGHTDQRSLPSLFPEIKRISADLEKKFAYPGCFRLGIAGGLGTPDAVAGAFAMGAHYVVTGSINQTAVQAGTSEAAKQLLAQADMSDTAITVSADMFEIGAKVQVLKKASLFSNRANQLHQLYKNFASIDEIPQAQRKRIEREIFQKPITQVYADVEAYFRQHNTNELEKAQSNEKHKMALIFRWYLGQSSRWAIQGEVSRHADYQLWAGPALGAFNQWVSSSFLAELNQRDIAQIAFNLLEGATVITRAQQLRAMGVPVDANCFMFKPRRIRANQ